MNSTNQLEILNPVIAGYMAGSVATIVHHPLESLKVLMQTENSLANAVKNTSSSSAGGIGVVSSSSNNSTLVSNNAKRNLSTMSIDVPSANKRSLRSLYSGLTGPLVSIGMVTSLNFAIYDSLRRILYLKQHPTDSTCTGRNYIFKDSISNIAFASTVTGVLMSGITSPVVVVKTKQQITTHSFLKTAKSTLRRKGGIRNFYVGFAPHFLCECGWRGIYFTSYEYLKRCISPEQGIDFAPRLPLYQSMTCAGLAGFLSWICIYPIDVVRSKMYAQAALTPNHPQPLTSKQMVMSLWNEAGFKIFYRKMYINILRLMPLQMTLLPCYDLALHWMNSDNCF